MPKIFEYGEEHLTAGKALALAKGQIKGVLTKDTLKKINASKEIVSHIVAKGAPVYGINTGFGPLCTTSISKEETKILQSNILKAIVWA